MSEKEKNIVVGFWLRLLSDIIDALILGLSGLLLALSFKKYLYGFGENGLFIGLIITFLYTGILQSHIGHGQSLAKRLLKIQVLNMDGTYQGLPKAFFRYSIIAFIFYNSWIWMSLTSIFPFVNNQIYQTIFTYFIVFLFFGVIILVAFHPLKRGLHDLLANSIVVRKGMFDKDKIESLNIQPKVNRSYIILGSCCALLLVLSSYMIVKQNNSTSLLSELSIIQKDINKKTLFKNVSVNHNVHTHKNSEGLKTITTSINIRPFLKKDLYDNKDQQMKEIMKTVHIILESYSKLEECDYINVQVRTGFNLGICKLYMQETTSFDNQGNLYKSAT